jgi:peptidoglycan hydrolase CwlO-like protein
VEKKGETMNVSLLIIAVCMIVLVVISILKLFIAKYFVNSSLQKIEKIRKEIEPEIYRIKEISFKAGEIADIIRDVSVSTKKVVISIDDVVDDTSNKIKETTTEYKNTLTELKNEINTHVNFFSKRARGVEEYVDAVVAALSGIEKILSIVSKRRRL